MLFSDESKIELGSFTNDSIRLDPQKQKWNEESYNLINTKPKNLKNHL